MNLVELSAIVEPSMISELSEEQLRELQIALNRLGLPAGPFDGLIGPRTRNAWAEFKSDYYPGNPDMIGAESIAILQELIKGTNIGLGNHDFNTKHGVIEAIKNECKSQGIGIKTQIAYVLATVEWETAQTFRPVKEAFWHRDAEQWRKDHLRYYPYYGRGFVQLTWRRNYERYSSILGVDLVSDPDMALNGDIALFILVHGFKTGTFTGRKITDYINNYQTDFARCRRCINGNDKATEIARLAEKFLLNL